MVWDCWPEGTSSGPFSRRQLCNWAQQAVTLHLSTVGTGLRAGAAEVTMCMQDFPSDSSDVKEKPGKEH